MHRTTAWLVPSANQNTQLCSLLPLILRSILRLGEDRAVLHSKSAVFEAPRIPRGGADQGCSRIAPRCSLSYFMASFSPCLFNFIYCFVLGSFSCLQSAPHVYN